VEHVESMQAVRRILQLKSLSVDSWIVLKFVYVTILISAKDCIHLAQDRFHWWSLHLP